MGGFPRGNELIHTHTRTCVCCSCCVRLCSVWSARAGGQTFNERREREGLSQCEKYFLRARKESAATEKSSVGLDKKISYIKGQQL